MIDFIKIHYRDKSRFEPFMLNEQNFEDVYKTVEFHTGEINYPYRTSYESMDYGVSEKTGYIKNSLHKFYNVIKKKGEHNYNNFTYSNLCESIDLLLKKMIDDENTRITQLEFGLNITTSIPAEEIIRRNIMMHKHKGVNHNKKFYGQGEFKQFDHHNYFIKIYDKAKQYKKEFRLKQNILRFELKFTKAIEFQKAGVFNITDLKDKAKLRKLFILLLERFDELTIIDDLDNMNLMNSQDMNNFHKYLNPRFWESLSEQGKRQSKSRYKKDFERIQREFNLNQTKQELRSLLFQKFIFLINN
ncbi:MAG: hypothetical protein ACI8ZX_002361 [Planctomycetota bacterium]|jgi:hypothetical protein